MRGKQVLLVVGLLVLVFGLGRLSVTRSVAAGGTLDSPKPPGDTLSYTLADIYNRLKDGAPGAKSAFSEPTTGPTAGTGHTLDEVMAVAPAADDANGAYPSEVLAGRTFWGLNAADLAWGPLTGTRPSAPVPRTGQTACYDAGGTPVSCTGTGQDGEYQRGVAWPNPRFTDNLNGTVTDNLTGLIWLQDANCYGEVDWALAITHTLMLDSGECSLSDGSAEGDWRLPNVRELQSLVDYGRYWPALPIGHPFTGVQSSGYWSGTTVANGTGYAWDVHLTDGYVYAHPKAYTYYVWPVRGGQ
jgi:hypothetical protein